MKLRMFGPMVGLLIPLISVSPALAGPAKVSIRVEGQGKALVSQRTLTTTTQSFTKDGDPSHPCPGTSAGGALQQATGGAWSGSYTEGLGYFVDTIKGEKHPGTPDYWAFWVNHKQASQGLCATELRPRDQVLFFVDSCTYDAATMGCSNQPVLPLGLHVARRVGRCKFVTASVVIYSAAGRATPRPGATIYAGKHALGKTNAKGRLRLRFRQARTVTLVAKKRGAVESESRALTVR